MITVVIANYRYEHLAAQAIESVLCQTRKADKVLFVDDGSYGEYSGQVHISTAINPYVPTSMDVIRRPGNLGVVANFDDILRNHITTDKVMFLGADNWLRPDALELMDKVDADIVSSDIYLVGDQAEDFAKNLKPEYGYIERKDGYPIWRFVGGDIKSNNFIHGSSLYNVEKAKKFGYERHPTSTRTAEDWVLWQKMLGDGAIHRHVPEPLLYYRRHARNSNTTR